MHRAAFKRLIVVLSKGSFHFLSSTNLLDDVYPFFQECFPWQGSSRKVQKIDFAVLEMYLKDCVRAGKYCTNVRYPDNPWADPSRPVWQDSFLIFWSWKQILWEMPDTVDIDVGGFSPIDPPHVKAIKPAKLRLLNHLKPCKSAQHEIQTLSEYSGAVNTRRSLEAL
ncbi:MAG: hypothetical protein Q9206_002556 [Seirophora lacunosa]